MNLGDLVRSLSGCTNLVIGHYGTGDLGDQYCPTVASNKWMYKGTCVGFEKTDLYEELSDRVVGFISVMDKGYLRILVKDRVR